MRVPDDLFTRLSKSRFRSGFTLKGRELSYLKQNGLDAVMEHAGKFVDVRLAPRNPVNDGRQTPTRNHPVFIAQHATATCCRKCLFKWHGIVAEDHELTLDEKNYVLEVLKIWLSRYM